MSKGLTRKRLVGIVELRRMLLHIFVRIVRRWLLQSAISGLVDVKGSS